MIDGLNYQGKSSSYTQTFFFLTRFRLLFTDFKSDTHSTRGLRSPYTICTATNLSHRHSLKFNILILFAFYSMHHSYPTPIPQPTFLNSYGPPGMANQDSTYPLSPSSANAKFGTTCNRCGDATSIIHSKIFVNSIFLLIIRLSKYEPECHVDFSILLAKEEIVLMTNSIVSDTGFPGLRSIIFE